MSLHSLKNYHERADFLRKTEKIQIDAIEKAFTDDETKVHCENLIGAVTIPVGAAGPLRIQGEYCSGDYFLPLATTEGALVASVNRGCKAIMVSGQVTVFADKVGATRGPVFYTPSLSKRKAFSKWIYENESLIKQEAEATSQHLIYRKIMIRSVSAYTYLRIYYDTDDAMGMNMATIATQKVADLIEKHTKASCIAVAGNFDIDKKPAWLNFIENRGFTVSAEVVLNENAIHNVLKTTAKKLHEVWLAKCMFGSAMSGSLGFNAHYANISAALFAATGQDLAHVVEASMGITSVLIQEDGSVYFSIYMPAVMVGTVGGGTNLKTQNEALKILGIKKSAELAEILGGAVLAGELSLLSSIAEGSLAGSHARLGR